MSEYTLFGIIAALLFSTGGVGVYAAVEHPDVAAALLPEAASVVTSAVSDATGTVAHALAVATRTDSGAREDFQDSKSSQSAGDDESASSRGGSDDDSGGEREDGDDEDDEGDDSSGGRIAVQSSAGAAVQTQPAQAQTASQSQGAPVAGTITMQQVVAHNTAASCYTAIGGNVYNLTPFITQHPGGSAAIKSLCGIEGTAAFNAQHGGQGNPAQELASLKIGVLAK
mgnify:CR=1 FL=1